MRSRPYRKDREARRGAALAEMAIVLPILLFLMVAIIDYARLSYQLTTITTCARNGALWASDPASQAQSPYANLTAAARADATNLSTQPTVDAPMYSATAAGPYTSTTPISNGYVEVTVRWTFTTLITYPGIPHTKDLVRSVRMRMLPAAP